MWKISLVVFLTAACAGQIPPAKPVSRGLAARLQSGVIEARPQEVAAALAGQRESANALWWGFDPADATGSIQGAIDSGASVVRVPDVGLPWQIQPIQLRSHQEIVFDPGVIVVAKRGAFLPRAANLFRGDGVENVTLRGYGATFRMRKRDYTESPYSRSQWRHAVSLVSVRHIRIYGLRIESSGGDGIYLGVSSNSELPPYNENVHILDVVLSDNHRQGISVIAARGLLIENTRIVGTRGTAPQAGIDFEPNHPDEEITDCLLRGCRITNNAGAGLQVYLRRHDETSAPVSITVQDTVIRRNTLQLLITDAAGSARGTIRFIRSDIGWLKRIRNTESLKVTFEQ